MHTFYHALTNVPIVLRLYREANVHDGSLTIKSGDFYRGFDRLIDGDKKVSAKIQLGVAFVQAYMANLMEDCQQLWLELNLLRWLVGG